MIKYKRPKGTHDILPGETYLWRLIEDAIRGQAELFGFGEIRFPTFENTALFSRGVGESTDIVRKEMYTFTDKDGSSLTLRPEGTVCVGRSVLENGLYAGAMPLKLYYISSFFRRERPQAGRSREFFQFGAELYGAETAEADATVILLADSVIKSLKIKNVALKINSIGCKTCRKAHREALDGFIAKISGGLCPECAERKKTNPMRVLDCKDEKCRALTLDAPVPLGYLCPECAERFEKLKELLTASGLVYEVAPRIVRGLDYYTGTVFEFIGAEEIGAQSAICGGGRYSGLIEELGGAPLSGAGFGMGISRLILAMRLEGLVPENSGGVRVYIAPVGAEAALKAFALADGLRKNGVSAETDLTGKSLKAQMKYADKTGAEYVLVIGGEEIARNSGLLQNMRSAEKIKVDLSFDSIMESV